MKPLVVLEIPALTCEMVRRHAPRLAKLASRGGLFPVEPDLPAVTMPGHATILTGKKPSQHGIVANGYFDRSLNQVFMWPQSERLVEGEKIWEAGKRRDPAFTCFKWFWWPGMASTADLYGNVRPVYFADGRKGGDVYTNRPGLSDELQEKFGAFPLFQFWGPGVNIASTRWIADTAIHLMERENPTLSLVYLPHLDYRQQSHGPGHPSIAQEVSDLDEVAGRIIDAAEARGAGVLAVSGYGIVPVDRPVYLNRVLREKGFLKVVTNAAGERIDFGTSRAFALADHQVAHVYVQDAAALASVREAIEKTPGVARVLDRAAQRAVGLDHPRGGELVVLAEAGAWFSYPYWLEDRRAPDFARCVAIHDKPGYDPCELFIDPALPLAKARIVAKVARKKLGFRMLMDVIPLDGGLVKGSHGLGPANDESAPALVVSEAGGLNSPGGRVGLDTVFSLIQRMIWPS